MSNSALDRGYYCMARGWMDNSVLTGEPYTKAQAWCWLIEQAAWRPCKANIKGKTVEIQRSQLSASIRYMGTAWQWHRARVERFLERLENEQMIETASETGQLIITICNYERYQSRASKGETATETPPRQQRDSNKDSKRDGAGHNDSGFAPDRETATETPPERKARQKEEEERNKEEATPSALASDVDTKEALFRLGERIIEGKSRGLVAKLLSTMNGDIAATARVLERAETMEVPREYVAAATRNDPSANDPYYNGLMPRVRGPAPPVEALPDDHPATDPLRSYYAAERIAEREAAQTEDAEDDPNDHRPSQETRH